MANVKDISVDKGFSAQTTVGETVFRIPIGKLGLFPRVLLGGACGFVVFFIAFFFSIVGVAIFDSATGRSIQNLSISYLYIAAPVGVLAILIFEGYLIASWARRRLRGAA